jgi:sodium transport system permease protein
MTISNVKLIFAREVRDQLRDRRTLFVVAVLPIILYPLLGVSLLQVSQFMREQPTRVLVIGAENLAGSPALFDLKNGRFSEQLFTDPSRAKLLDLRFASVPKCGTAAPGCADSDAQPRAAAPRGAAAPQDARADADRQVQSGACEAALYFPPDFAARLDAFRRDIGRRAEDRTTVPAAAQQRVPKEVPSPEVIYSTANDKSQLAFLRLSDVLRRWTQRIGDDNLKASGVSEHAAHPFSVNTADVADARRRNGAMWSKILPVLLLLWALTGAFYPAIDLCAGEKERGTLETLLSSPAQRSEIVVGKLLTIMLFSIVTAVLNLASIAITGSLVLPRMSGFGLPPLGAMAVVVVALVPVAALFSALCLALAAFARSTKEGQYYLMPLLLAVMPLVILPMSPGVELNLGNSLVPVTGVVLLLRSVLVGDYWQAFQYLPVVAVVTLLACLMSIRWAVDQFNSESVLFRESERLDVGMWLRHLLRDRKPTPTVAAAVCCGVLILVADFFMGLSQTATPTDLRGLIRASLVPQLAVIAPVALLMTVLFTSSPRKTLLLKRPPWLAVPAAALLALLLHPAANFLKAAVQQLYPVSESIRPSLEKVTAVLHDADFWPLLLVIALAPAVCEELAFRGFILSGFRHLGRKWRAIIYSALLFGLAHGILQQSLIASLLGVVLGYMAVQSGSILPGMIFHVCHNALAVANSRITPEMFQDWTWLHAIAAPVKDGGCVFDWPVVAFAAVAGALVLVWFGRLPCEKSPEESLEDAIERGEHQASPLAHEEVPCSLSAPDTCSP